jgi:hypothetical protein
MNEFKGGALLPFDTGVESFALDKNGTVYDLHAGGALDCYNPGARASVQWSLVASGVESLASADMGGSVWYLKSDGSLWITGDAVGTREISGQGTTDIVTAESGRTVYALASDGLLYRGSDAIGGMAPVDTGVAQMATADQGGSVWYLKSNGCVWVTGDAGGTRGPVAGGATELMTAESGRTVYVSESNGVLYRGSDAIGGVAPVAYTNGAAVIGVTQFATADLGGSVWFLESNGSVWVTGDTAGTRQVGSGATEVETGQSGLTAYVLDGDGLFYIGSDSIGGMAPVAYTDGAAVTGVRQFATADLGGSVWFLESNGSLWVTGDSGGTRQVGGGDVELATGPWGLTVYVLGGNGVLYQGSDAIGGMATVYRDVYPLNNPTALDAYSPVGGSLFGAGGPSYRDVEQGAVGDCWLLASLAEAAARAPSDIENMFTYIGTAMENGALVGLYTVRFFNSDGTAKYVTVDTELPAGGTYYDHVTNALGTQALWVALAEKAYAVANGFGCVTSSDPGSDSYAALNGGWPSWALQAITGRPAGDYSINSTNLVSDWNSGDLIVLTTDTPPSSYIVAGHCYALVDYNAASSLPFELFNPWGTTNSPPSGSAPGTIPLGSAPNAPNVYGLFWADTAFLSQNFTGQSLGAGAAPGLDGHGGGWQGALDMLFALDPQWFRRNCWGKGIKGVGN